MDQITNKAMGHLLSYPYPGNIRELDQIITRSILTTKGPSIQEEDLPGEVTEFSEILVLNQPVYNFSETDLSLGYKELRQQFERQLVGFYMKKSGGNITKAAVMAKIERESLHRIMKRLNFPR